jgi:uncharacterized protein (DUF4213/DUF364 family)
VSIIRDLISTLNADAIVRDIRQGPFWTAVCTRHCGLAATPHDPAHKRDAAPREVGHLRNNAPAELVHMAFSEGAREAAIGMAAINSLIEVEEGRCVELNAVDVILKKGAGKKVALVGHFPFADRIRETAGELWVIERQPRDGDLPEDQAPAVVPQADVVGITGSAFVNHTIEDMLRMCDPKACVVVLGPTTPLSSVLLDYGVDVVSGTVVADPELVLRQVSEGVIFRHMEGVRLLTMTKE